MSTKVVIATNNAHKLVEIERILGPLGFEFCALSECEPYPEPREDADSFEGNARIKAYAAREHTGLPALADDSGLMVDALDGAPGVYSSRFAGEHASDADNNAKLLKLLEAVPDEKRTARFVCTIVYVDVTGNELVATGSCEGKIGHEKRGTGGFGYDPLFISDDCGGLTTAEVTPQQKDAISHRGRALHKMAQLLARQ